MAVRRLTSPVAVPIRVGVVVICALALLVCIRSVWTKYTWFDIGSRQTERHWGLFQGKLNIVWWPRGTTVYMTPTWVWYYQVRTSIRQESQWLPSCVLLPGSGRLIVPVWLPATAALATGAWAASPWWLVPLRRRARLAAGRCDRCGYDRRGLAAQARCPECAALGPGPGPVELDAEERLREALERWAGAGVFVFLRCADGVELVYRPWAVWRDTDGGGPIWLTVGLVRDVATGRERRSSLRLDRIREARPLIAQPKRRRSS